MGIEYVNRRGERYFLQRGTTKTGRVHYWVGRKLTGTPADTLPEGYEIHERPETTQAFLRRITPTQILPLEVQMAQEAARKHVTGRDCLVEVHGFQIVIYLSDVDPREVAREMGMLGERPTAHRLQSYMDYRRGRQGFDKMLRFTLVEPKTRRFGAERWCFRGSIDNWIYLHDSGPLARLLDKYLPHLGNESFYELM